MEYPNFKNMGDISSDTVAAAREMFFENYPLIGPNGKPSEQEWEVEKEWWIGWLHFHLMEDKWWNMNKKELTAAAEADAVKARAASGIRRGDYERLLASHKDHDWGKEL